MEPKALAGSPYGEAENGGAENGEAENGVAENGVAEAGDADYKASKRVSVVSVNHTESSSSRREEKETAGARSVSCVELRLDPPTFSEQFARMFTTFPWRDANYTAAIAFVVGSAFFLVNAFMGLFAVVAPETDFPNEAELAIPLTTLVGVLLFLVGGTLVVPVTWNADQGTLEAGRARDVAVRVLSYRPALLGSSAWVWCPSRAQLPALLKTVPFQAALTQVAGAAVLCIAVVGGWPGVIAPDNITGLRLFLFGPLTVGGALFFYAYLRITVWLQHRWWKPRPGSAAWEAAFFTMIGSLNFAIAGLVSFKEDILTATITTFVGSIAFLIGSVISWYDIMAFHPNDWAAW